jgi:peptide/nickel transport system ATP-binding protein/oligopeptide transport system ATP-binding protein
VTTASPETVRPIASVSELSTTYRVRDHRGAEATLTAVDRVSLEVQRGETVGLVGESGCGKSSLGRTMVRLTDAASGQICFDGHDITTMSHRRLRPLRRHMQMVFQDPYASLNPRATIRQILEEPMRIHGAGRAGRGPRVRELLDLVHLPAAVSGRRPHEFSGGQRQRIAIARALALQPTFLVLDEPVSALDMSIQAQILNLLGDLRRELGLSYLFIAHDLSAVGHISARVAVMYLGKIVEVGERDTVFRRPQHPYTNALLSAVPTPARRHGGRRRIVLAGDLPSPMSPPSGCRFRTRCWRATEICAEQEPPLVEVPSLPVSVACHHPGTEGSGDPTFDRVQAAR